jgi:hypothetical protein
MTTCPHCQRTVSTPHGHYSRHGLSYDSDDYCPLSAQPVPVHGDDPQDYRRRAFIITHLAGQIRDLDPIVTAAYLNALSHDEMRRLLTIACAAIPTDQTPTQIWSWVCDLQVAA